MRMTLLLLSFVSLVTLASERPEFTLHKIESAVPGPTVLIVGGIQGDEPGGFHAASLLVTDYKVTKGKMWVVPNLNFQSIIKRSRGVNGDMNRKFAAIQPGDPDYAEVQRIKALIRNPEVDFIFNLHDGSGFYRPKHLDKWKNPQRWGQSIIIDQEFIKTNNYSNVGELSTKVAKAVNKHLLNKEHRYHVKNTKTRMGNEEMAKTLTYYAINRGNSAVGIEASKSLPTHQRVYYHLHVIEAFLDVLGVSIERDFELNPTIVKRTIDENISIALFKNKMLLDMVNARNRIGYVPMKKNSLLEFEASNPLVAITSNKGSSYRVSFGNRRLTDLHPQFFEYDSSVDSIPLQVDGNTRQVNLGTIVEVENHFTVNPLDGYRVNVIGWTKKGVTNEVGHQIKKKNIVKRFSVDKLGTLFRIEVYREKKFTGMVLVKFTDKNSVTDAAKTADNSTRFPVPQS